MPSCHGDGTAAGAHFTTALQSERRGGQGRRGKQRRAAVAPRFPRDKDEGWLLLLADAQRDELWALKRISHPPAQVRCVCGGGGSATDLVEAAGWLAGGMADE